MLRKAIKTKNQQQAILLLAGVILIIIGIVQGDYSDTLTKALRICLECVGIG